MPSQSERRSGEYEPGTPQPVRRDDPILFGPRWRKALQEIADADPVDMILDPTWSQRIAREALR